MFAFLGIGLVLAAPLWLLLMFAAYAIGRRKFELWTLFALVTAEAVSLSIWVATWAENKEVSRATFCSDLGFAAVLGAPCWIPIVGVTYAQARGRYGPAFTTVLVAIELLSIALWCVSIRAWID